jgi:ATP-dependent DNA helicase RecQ
MNDDVPPNVVMVKTILAERGPLDAAALTRLLRDKGMVLRSELLQRLPNLYPRDFAVDGQGRLALAVQIGPRPTIDDESALDSSSRAWWTEPDSLTPISLDDVVVVDIETTGLDPRTDHLWQVAACHMGSGERLVMEVDHEGRTRDPQGRPLVPLGEALAALDRMLSSAAAVAGHRVGQFDLPFLATAAEGVGRCWHCDLPVLDLYVMSLLVDPTLPSRTLEDLADAFGVALDRPHEADADVAATAELLRLFVKAYNPLDPAWALARRLLAEAGDAWARVLPPGTLPASLDFLAPRSDPLATRAGGEAWRSARQAVREGFARLEAVGFRHRPGQRTMAEAVAEALDDGGRLAVEAPTGTGKSLAYLVSAAGRAGPERPPVVVATRTKVLQRQLREEAMRLRQLGILAAPFRQLQGVANYLCTREIAGTVAARAAEGGEWLAIAVAVRALGRAENGVWDDVNDELLLRSDVAYARRRLSLRATPNTCDRTHCDHVSRCPLFARLHEVGSDAGVIAVNHALMASWVDSSGHGARTPGDVLGSGTDAAIVIDEAHDLEDALTSAWTKSTGAMDLDVLLGWIYGRWGPLRVARTAARATGLGELDVAELQSLRPTVEETVRTLGTAVGAYLHEFGGEEEQVTLLWGVVRARPEFRALVSAALDVVAMLRQLDAALGRLGAQLGGRTAGGQASDDARSPLRRAGRMLWGARAEVQERIELLGHLRDLDDHHRYVHVLLAENGNDARAEERWLFQRIPIEVGGRFAREVVGRARTTVLTSATLRVAGSFDFLARRLGIAVSPDADGAFSTLTVESPFRYDKQSAVVLMSHLPLPVPASEREFCEDFAADQVGFLSLTGGRTLTLFAARARMEAVAAAVRQHERELAERGVDLLVQGEDSISRLTTLFRKRPGAVLYGLRSFWAGFDAPGETLSYLVIEKPPWPHPGDPVVAARQQAIAERGGDPFLEYVVPSTAIALAQAFGRLIRSETDRGVALIADRRMQTPTRAYRQLLDTLPTTAVHFAEDRNDAWTYAIRFVTGEDPDLSGALELRADTWSELLEELRILPGEDPTTKLCRAAREVFGIQRLRDEQLELMRALVEGRDVLGFLPTGSGKSICFQLPALLHPDRRPTVVVSPLVALIKDQVDDLRGRRSLRSVRGITGRTTRAEREDVLRRLVAGDLRLVYVSPERLVRDPMLRAALAGCQLGALVVDEAHCVSSWGYDFRPEFRQVVKPLLSFERSPRMALTATATPEVEQDLKQTLYMADPRVVRQAVNRPDLRYWVHEVHSERERSRELLRFIGHQGSRPGIVYASRRTLTEELAWILRQAGLTARAYHAGMVPEQREAVQDDFLAGTTQVVVATKAFGLGVNKPDIAWIVHYDLPESLEAYAQETGRAARHAELEGDCLLLYSRSDIARRRGQAGSTGVDLVAAQRLVDGLGAFPMRGQSHLVDPEDFAQRLGIDVDELDLLVAWLEQIGTCERHTDATLRAAIEIGSREPKDRDQRQRFVRFKQVLGVRVGTRRLINLDDAAAALQMDPDELEHQLVDWSLESLLSFSSTRRAWRIEPRTDRVDRAALQRLLQHWRALERHRVDQIVDYATGSGCRRRSIAAVFADPDVSCGDGGRTCDICDGGAPFWHAFPLARVPDPETLVDVELVVLQAVLWATRGQARGHPRRYSEASLRATLCGTEVIGSRPLPPALFNCPHFGALRYLRGRERRFDTAVEVLVERGLVKRTTSSYQERTYQTLELTDVGRAALGRC